MEISFLSKRLFNRTDARFDRGSLEEDQHKSTPMSIRYSQESGQVYTSWYRNRQGSFVFAMRA